MLNLGRKNKPDDEAYAPIQADCIQFMWNYLFNEGAAQYLDEALAQKALSSLSELLRNAKVELILAYFVKLIKNLKENNHGFFTIQVLYGFIRLYIDKP